MNYSEELKSLKAMHALMFIGVLLLLLVFYFLIRNEMGELSFDLRPLEGWVLFLALSIPALYQVAYQRKLKAITQLNSVEDKWTGYRQMQIIRYASLEAPALLCSVMFFIMKSPLFLVLSLLFAFVLVSYRPMSSRIEYETGLKIEE